MVTLSMLSHYNNIWSKHNLERGRLCLGHVLVIGYVRSGSLNAHSSTAAAKLVAQCFFFLFRNSERVIRLQMKSKLLAKALPLSAESVILTYLF